MSHWPLDRGGFEEHIVRGQYTASASKAGYREEKNVAPDSRTETYITMKNRYQQLAVEGCSFLYPYRQTNADKGD